MKHRIFVDTSALYALLDADDPVHEQAVAHWKHAVELDREFVTTQFVFVETHAVMLRRLGSEAIADLDAIALAIEIAGISPETLSAARRRWEREGRRQLSLVDCCSFEFMERQNIVDALAFDRHFREFAERSGARGADGM